MILTLFAQLTYVNVLHWIVGLYYYGCLVNGGKIMGYRGKAKIVSASNTKIPLTSENATSPNEKLLANG